MRRGEGARQRRGARRRPLAQGVSTHPPVVPTLTPSPPPPYHLSASSPPLSTLLLPLPPAILIPRLSSLSAPCPARAAMASTAPRARPDQDISVASLCNVIKTWLDTRRGRVARRDEGGGGRGKGQENDGVMMMMMMMVVMMMMMIMLMRM
eukprot:9500716-Pyramimonas_sp.AAC.1